MKSETEALFSELESFIGGSFGGLVQLLVAAAGKRTYDRITACPTYPVPVKKAGLYDAVRKLQQALHNPEVRPSTLLARLYASARSLEQRKRIGQFFTSPEVAEWALSLESPLASDAVCDAGAGTATFAEAILRGQWSVKSYVGVENDPVLALCAAHVLESVAAPAAFKILYANFLLLKREDFEVFGLKPPTLVIANPPFVRFHNLKSRARVRKDLQSSLGVSLSSFSGSGNYFLSRAADLTRTSGGQRGRMLFFLPKEAEGAAHAKRLRLDLELLHGWNSTRFEVPIKHTGIDRHPSNALALLYTFKQQKALATGDPNRSSEVACVADIIHVKRGISTGCNSFFVLTDQEVRQRRIPRQYLRGVLPTRIPMNQDEISQDNWDQLRRQGLACWLLSLPNDDIDDFEPPVQDYLREGLRRGIHETPTARSFKKWHSIRIPAEPPDVFVTYLFRSAPRFVLNRARVLHLTNILGGRFVPPVEDPTLQESIVGSLNKLGKKWMESGNAGREYKGGLFKIEPGELSKLPIDKQTLKLSNPKKAFVPPRSLLLFG
jgi:predicted RNA methylase